VVRWSEREKKKKVAKSKALSFNIMYYNKPMYQGRAKGPLRIRFGCTDFQTKEGYRIEGVSRPLTSASPNRRNTVYGEWPQRTAFRYCIHRNLFLFILCAVNFPVCYSGGIFFKWGRGDEEQ